MIVQNWATASQNLPTKSSGKPSESPRELHTLISHGRSGRCMRGNGELNRAFGLGNSRFFPECLIAQNARYQCCVDGMATSIGTHSAQNLFPQQRQVAHQV